MNLLMIGSGGGSFEMRGRQLGVALGARVASSANTDDLAWADVVVLIKRAGLQHCDAVRRAGKPLVWDALDFWEQPSQNSYSEADAKSLLVSWLMKIRPALTIGATEQMAKDCGGVYLPHHCWNGLKPLPPNDTVKTVGYQGTRKYLGRWATAIQAECDRRGWAFVVNPQDLRYCDLIVALRDGQWDGWMCREWKSGVKLVNAMAAGRTVITQACSAARELRPWAVMVSELTDLSWAFNVTPSSQRMALDQSRIELDTVARQYRQILSSLKVAA